MPWYNLENSVIQWWWFLVIVSIINIITWFIIKKNYFANTTFRDIFTPKLYPHLIIWYSALYVFGCAFRSVLPKADVQRICLFDTWLSSVFVGRSVATVAEIAFVVQFAIILYAVSGFINSKFVRVISLTIVPIICVAECFSWYAVISTNYFGNMIEESLWAITFSLVGLSFIVSALYSKGNMRISFIIGVVLSLAYVWFMTNIDVPMYYTRWIKDIKNEREFLTLWEGLVDLNTRLVVTYDEVDWKDERLWMGLYFSFAVWVSLILNCIPLSQDYFKKIKPDSHYQ